MAIEQGEDSAIKWLEDKEQEELIYGEILKYNVNFTIAFSEYLLYTNK